MSQLVTGEAVALDLRPARLPSRLVAGLIDVAVQGTLLVTLEALLRAAAPSVDNAVTASLQIVVLFAVLAGFPIACESLWRGRTPGKAAMGLRVVRDDGGPIGFRQALVRGLTAMFVERPGATFFLGAVVCSLLNPASKRIGDVLAGTLVLQERVPVRGGVVATMPPPLASWAAGLELAGLSDGLALSVRSFVARSADLTDAAREDLGGRLVSAVSSVVTPPPPPGTPGWAYLAAVLAERRRREELRLGAPGSAPVTPAQPMWLNSAAAPPFASATPAPPAESPRLVEPVAITQPPSPAGGFAPPA